MRIREFPTLRLAGLRQGSRIQVKKPLGSLNPYPLCINLSEEYKLNYGRVRNFFTALYITYPPETFHALKPFCLNILEAK